MHSDLIKPFRGNVDAHLLMLAVFARRHPLDVLAAWQDQQGCRFDSRRRASISFSDQRRARRLDRWIGQFALGAVVGLILAVIGFVLTLILPASKWIPGPALPVSVACVSALAYLLIASVRPDSADHDFEGDGNAMQLASRLMQLVVRDLLFGSIVGLFGASLCASLPDEWAMQVAVGVPLMVGAIAVLISSVRWLRRRLA